MSALPDPAIETLGGIRCGVRRSDGEGTPVVFVHGNPSASFDWIPFAERLRNPVVAFDLPGFGVSERPDPARFDGSMGALAAWIGTALDELGLERFKLVVHDWGAIALQPAAERAERVERLVVINAVPLLAGYRWHWVARIWRRRRLGELFNATTTRAVFRLAMRQARPGFRAMPDEWLDEVWRSYDAGTRRAVLALYRSADPEPLREAGAGLGRLRCPSLVAWGGRDPYIGADWGRAYAAALPGSELIQLPGAGHWPWFDRPDLIGTVAAFLEPDR